MTTPEPAPLKCPHCGESDPRFFEQWKAWYFCQVCGKTWPIVHPQDVSGNPIDGP